MFNFFKNEESQHEVRNFLKEPSRPPLNVSKSFTLKINQIRYRFNLEVIGDEWVDVYYEYNDCFHHLCKFKKKIQIDTITYFLMRRDELAPLPFRYRNAWMRIVDLADFRGTNAVRDADRLKNARERRSRIIANAMKKQENKENRLIGKLERIVEKVIPKVLDEAQKKLEKEIK